MADDPACTDPDKYRVVFENNQVRVLEYRDTPGYQDPSAPARRPRTCCSSNSELRNRPDAQSLESTPEVIAPDGSTVRPLCRVTGLGSFALSAWIGRDREGYLTATVQEIWHIIGSSGRMWRRQKGAEATIVRLLPGYILTIPLRIS